MEEVNQELRMKEGGGKGMYKGWNEGIKDSGLLMIAGRRAMLAARLLVSLPSSVTLVSRVSYVDISIY